jgi:hypothetical protein
MAGRWIAWGLAGLCAAFMVLLLFKSPSAELEGNGEDPGEKSVECSPVIRVGWPSDFSGLQPEADWDHFSDHVEGDTSLSFAQRLGIAQDCDERRTTYLALIAVATLLASIFMSIGVAAGARRPRT